ncbi:MAG: PQQ-binding-like beta-propeller repeat protein [Thermoanaerobaculaceae bacterium]
MLQPPVRKVPPDPDVPLPTLPDQPQGAPHVFQTWDGPLAMPSPLVSFQGIGQGFSGPGGTYNVWSVPPDTTGDVGPHHYVQWVNTAFAVFSKTGTVLYGPAGGSTLWSGFGGGCEMYDDGDPIVQYDQLADRWLMTQFAVGDASNNLQCIAVSTSPDPTGSYYRYAFSFGSQMNDYPKFGVWPDGYYASYNMFTTLFQGSKACAYDRAKMLTGDPAAVAVCTSNMSSYPSLVPVDLEGFTLPPSGSPAYFVNSYDGTTDYVRLFKYSVNWASPGSSTFTGPTNLTVTSFTPACSGGVCVPQPSVAQQLDTLATRLMYRLAYRNQGTHESMVITHSVTSGGVAAIRWYELRNPGSTPVVYQQGTYQPDSVYRWMGSAAMDAAGNIAVGYSVSSNSVYPGIRYAGRLSTDAPGTFGQGETTMQAGIGSQDGADRWGDYSTLSVDPVDLCTFWYTNQYQPSTDAFNWNTRIGAFKFPTLAAPGGVTASASGNNRVVVQWNANASATSYRVYRSLASGGPHTHVGTVAGPGASPVSFDDTGVSGGETYYYVVRAFTACGSDASAEVSVTTAGACQEAPRFEGILSVGVPLGATTCALQPTWEAATPVCGSSVVYNVYRSTTHSFTPSDDNRVATALTGTSYVDSEVLSNGTTYYYLVRAVDASTGVQDANTVVMSGVPARITRAIGEGFSSGNPPADWTVTSAQGTGTWTTANPGNRTIPPEVTSPVMIMDAAYYGTTRQTDYLVSPTFDASGASKVLLAFDTIYLDRGTSDTAYVDVSSNGGTSYTAVATYEDWIGKPDHATHVVIDITSAAGSAANARVRFRYTKGNNVSGYWWLVDNVIVDVQRSCTSPPRGVQALSATTYADRNTVEWLNPSTSYGGTRVNYRSDVDPTGPTDASATNLVAGRGTAGTHDAENHSGLSGSGLSYKYAAWVNSAAAMTGTWATPGDFVHAPPPNSIASPLLWAYSTRASALTEPRRLSGRGLFTPSNDRFVHAMSTGSTGGTWASGWLPPTTDGVVTAPSLLYAVPVGAATRVAIVAASDGYVYCFNADTGAELWYGPIESPPDSDPDLPLGMLQATPMLTHTSYGGSYNLVFVATRNATGANKLCALNLADGSKAWCFDNRLAQGGSGQQIGIISGAPYIDYANNAAYFTSRSRGGGSPNTLWKVTFNATSATYAWGLPLGDIDTSVSLNWLTDQLIVGTTSGTIHVVNKNGSAAWNRGFAGDGAVKGIVYFDSKRSMIYFSTTSTVRGIAANGSTGSDWSMSLYAPSRPLWPYNQDYLLVGACTLANCSTDGKLVQRNLVTNAVSEVVLPGASWVGGPTVDATTSPMVAYVGTGAGRVYAVQYPLP